MNVARIACGRHPLAFLGGPPARRQSLSGGGSSSSSGSNYTMCQQQQHGMSGMTCSSSTWRERQCSSFGSSSLGRSSRPRVGVQAAGGDDRGRGGLDPRLEVEVPTEQRPVNELQQLKQSTLYSWATLELPEYLKRLAVLYVGVFLLLGGPIAAQTFEPSAHPLEFFLAGSTGSLFVVSVTALRIFLGWNYVGARLLTATLEYEETGWYDGQVFVKPPEVLTRDRLLGNYEVKPVLRRLKTTLQLTGGTLLATAVALVVLLSATPDDSVRRISQVTPTGIIFSEQVRDLSELMNDDEMAELEAQAQAGIPGYCGDRYMKAVAGGEEVCTRLLERKQR